MKFIAFVSTRVISTVRITDWYWSRLTTVPPSAGSQIWIHCTPKTTSTPATST